MKKTQITVKEIDEGAFKELKVEAIRRKMTVGTALTLAINNWLSSLKKTRKSLLEWKPTDWGSGTERLSEEVDEIIYGDA